MSLDHLLIWMSARGAGSWQQFRAAVEEFRLEAEADGGSTEDADGTFRDGMPVYHQIRAALQALGHVEFSSLHDGRNWRVVPPTLAVTRRNDQWIGLACGARSPLLYERDQPQNPGLSWETTAASGMPSRIRVLSPVSHRLSEEATALGFLVQNSGPDALLAAIPPVDDPRCRQAADPPAGPDWLIERFSASDLHGAKLTEVTSMARTMACFD